jgi:hypothetical protein
MVWDRRGSPRESGEICPSTWAKYAHDHDRELAVKYTSRNHHDQRIEQVMLSRRAKKQRRGDRKVVAVRPPPSTPDKPGSTPA